MAVRYDKAAIKVSCIQVYPDGDTKVLGLPVTVSRAVFALFAFCLLISLLVIIVGCRQVEYSNEMNRQYRYFADKNHYNSKLIFDLPKKSSWDYYIAADEFGRKPWPVSPQAKKYITDYDTITYEESVNDFYYRSGDGRARDRYETYMRSTRKGRLFR